MKKHLFYVFALCLIGFLSQKITAQVRLTNIELGASYWERDYDGVSENTLINGNPESVGGWMPHLGAEIGLYRNFGIDGRVGLWTGSFETRGNVGFGSITETLDQRIIPVSLGLIYRSNSFLVNAMIFYAGAGINRYFIRNRTDYNISATEETLVIDYVATPKETFSNNNYGANVKAGLEYYIGPNWGMALEGRYNTGKYTQQYESSLDQPTEDIEIALRGFEVGLSLKFRFGSDSTTRESRLRSGAFNPTMGIQVSLNT